MFFIFLPVIKRLLLFPTAGSLHRYFNASKHRYSDWISTVYCVMYLTLSGVQLNSVHLKIRWIQVHIKATTLFIPHEKCILLILWSRYDASIQFDSINFISIGENWAMRKQNQTDIEIDQTEFIDSRPKCLIFCCTINTMLEIAFTACIIANVPLLQSPMHIAVSTFTFFS